MMELTKFCSQEECEKLRARYESGDIFKIDGKEYTCTSIHLVVGGFKCSARLMLKEKKKEWWEDIPEHGYLCKVWDQGDKEEHKCVEFVVDHNDTPFRYITETGELWEYAVPLTQEEVAKYTYTEGDS